MTCRLTLTNVNLHSLAILQTVVLIHCVWSKLYGNLSYIRKKLITPRNHCNKLYRFFLGRNVTVAHGLETTVAEYEALPSHKQNMIKEKFITLYEQSPLYHVLDEKRLLVCHAGIRQDYIGRQDKKYKPLYYMAILQEKNMLTAHLSVATGRRSIKEQLGLYMDIHR